MRIVRATFQRLSDVSVTDLIGAVGVYVIWDGKARARPTYIGEGTILQRLAQHAERFAWPFDGYVAITGDIGTVTAKHEAEILKTVLLAVAADTDRLPNNNKAPGDTRAIGKIFRSHNTLRIRVSGYDPLGIPWQARQMNGSKVATLRILDEELPPSLEHQWRLRRLQA